MRSRIAANGGGATVVSGSLSLARSQIVDNSGAIGGALALDSRISLRQSTIGRNRADGGPGGGLALFGDSSLDAVNATVAENSARLAGGGILVGAGARRA